VLFWLFTLFTLTAVKYHGDLRGLLHLGSQFPHPAALVDAPLVGPWGYDGQFYAALATDPLLLSPQTPALLDNPPYRAQRIFLPMLAHLVSLGDARAATFAYPLLCWLFTFVGFFALANLLQRFEVRGFWVFLAAAHVGVAASVTRSTPDSAGTGLFFLGWAAWNAGRPGVATALWGSAVLTRETLLLPLWGVILPQLWRQRTLKAALPGLVPTGMLTLWSGVLFLRFWPASPIPGGNLGVPLRGLAEKVALLSNGTGIHWMELLSFLGLLLLLLSSLQIKSWHEERSAAFFAIAILAGLLTIRVYEEAFAYSRVLLPLAWTGVTMVEEGRSWRRPLLVLGLVLQALAGLSLIHGEFLAVGGLRQVVRFFWQPMHP